LQKYFVKISEAISKRVLELLVARNMSQYRLEKIMAIPHDTMVRVMGAKNHSANVRTIFQICRGLDIPVGEFFTAPIFDHPELEID